MDVGNVPRTISALQVIDETDTVRDIAEVWVRDTNNVPRLVFSLAPPMTAMVTPDFVYGVTAGTGTAQSGAATAAPSGGVGPYTYAWTTESFTGPVPPNIDSPTTAATTFTQTGIPSGDGYSAVFRCTITDDLGNTAAADVGASFIDTGGPFP